MRKSTELSRFLAKVDQHGPVPGVRPDLGPCWTWNAGMTRNGYGMFSRADYSPVYAHRWAYEYFVGEIPEGAYLRHLCGRRSCPNPDHVSPIGHDRPTRGRSNAQKIYCSQGHPYDEENTGHSGGKRYCRTCKRERTRLNTRDSP